MDEQLLGQILDRLTAIEGLLRKPQLGNDDVVTTAEMATMLRLSPDAAREWAARWGGARLRVGPLANAPHSFWPSSRRYPRRAPSTKERQSHECRGRSWVLIRYTPPLLPRGPKTAEKWEIVGKPRIAESCATFLASAGCNIRKRIEIAPTPFRKPLLYPAELLAHALPDERAVEVSTGWNCSKFDLASPWRHPWPLRRTVRSPVSAARVVFRSLRSLARPRRNARPNGTTTARSAVGRW